MEKKTHIACANLLSLSLIRPTTIPSLGTGFHGYKHNEVSKPVINLLYNYCNTNNVDIYFINLNKQITDIYQKKLDEIR